MSVYSLYRGTMLLIALNIQLHVCFEWLKTLPYQERVQANNTGSVTFSWQYQITSSDDITQPNSLLILCGYIIGTDFTELVRRVDETGTMTTTNQVVFGPRNVVVANPNNRIISFRINNVQKNDPIPYRCKAIVNQLKTTAGLFESPVSFLEILDRPTFVNCLENISPVVSNQNLEITCQVIGNPIPNLKCQLFSYTGVLLESLPRSDFLKQNITKMSFTAIKPEASTISCIAIDDTTGSASRTVSVQVKHPPFAPKEFSVQFRTASSLLLTWLKIPENETGTDFTEYRLEYYISTIGALNKTMIKIPQSSNSYLLDGLLYNTEYTLFLSGFNIYGQGPSVSLTAIPYGLAEIKHQTGSKVGIVIGAVIGAVVFAIIIAAIIIWFTKRSDKTKRYPLSYAADAVKYPLTQEKNSLYAGVENKKKGAFRKDSTSGYPDVVMGADDQKSNLSSYEMSNKVYV